MGKSYFPSSAYKRSITRPRRRSTTASLLNHESHESHEFTQVFIGVICVIRGCILHSPQAPKIRRWRWGLLIVTPGQAVWGRDPKCAEFVRRFCTFDLTTKIPYRFESKYSYHRRTTDEFAAIFLLAMRGYLKKRISEPLGLLSTGLSCGGVV